MFFRQNMKMKRVPSMEVLSATVSTFLVMISLTFRCANRFNVSSGVLLMFLFFGKKIEYFWISILFKLSLKMSAYWSSCGAPTQTRMSNFIGEKKKKNCRIVKIIFFFFQSINQIPLSEIIPTNFNDFESTTGNVRILFGDSAIIVKI